MSNMIRMEYSNTITPLIEWVLNNKPKWFESSLKSVGWRSQQEIKKGIKSGAPGGRPYSIGMSAAKRREIDDVMYSKNPNRAPRRMYPFMGKLGRAVVYDKSNVSSGTIMVGWASRSAVRLGSWQEKGVAQNVTSKMRHMLFAAGIGIRKSKQSINNPQRQTYKAMKPIIQQKAPLWMKEKIESYINGNEARSASRRQRRYRVYG